MVCKKKLLKSLNNNPENAYSHSRYIIEGRFELGEKVISRDYYYSYWYAREILKGRFELGEEAIAKDPMYSYMYARDIIKGRFILGEESIKEEISIYDKYKQFLKSKGIEINGL